MNFFSVLDDSDNDEPKVAKTAAKKTTAAPKKNDGHPEEKYRVVRCND